MLEFKPENKTKHLEISITNTKGTNSLVINEAKILNCKQNAKKHTKPVTMRAAMLGESKDNSELCLNEPL